MTTGNTTDAVRTGVFFRELRNAVRCFLTGAAILFPAAMLLGGACAFAARRFGFEPGKQSSVAKLFENIENGKALAVVALFTLVPLVEETIFRWIPLFCVTRVTENLSGKKARLAHIALDIATSALFAAAHRTPVAALPLFLLGLAFMHILRRRGLHCSIAAHAGFNFAAVAVALAMHAGA